MNNNDERDYAEEAANRLLMQEGDGEETVEAFEAVEYCVCDVFKPISATAPVVEEIRHWYITFGYDHRDHVTGRQLWHRYCIVEDTYEGARDQIIARFGTGWSMIYAHANDLPVVERTSNGRELPAYKWRGAGVLKYGLTYFDHRMEEPTIADKIELDREKAGYYDPDE